MDKLIKKLNALSQMQVYVGVPEEKAARMGEPINNAQLMFVHTNGSELRKIPARPVIEPAIRAAGTVEFITDELQEAAKAILQGDKNQAKQRLNKAGQIGQNAAREWFTDPRNNWPPNADSTVLAKLDKITDKKKREAAKAVIDAGGSVEGVNTPLIDTGDLRKSIVYVVGMSGQEIKPGLIK
jgi:hypothetical protein